MLMSSFKAFKGEFILEKKNKQQKPPKTTMKHI